MASVSKIFKPRRGLASTMAGSGKKNIVLQKGEFFLEAPSGGMGTGASKVKVGDGTTAYSSLPYALGDTSNDKIDFSNNTSTTVANALTSVASGKALKTIIGGLKQAISLCNTSITKLNDDINNMIGTGDNNMTLIEMVTELYNKSVNTNTDKVKIITSSFSASNPYHVFESVDGYELVDIYAQVSGFSDKYTTSSTSFTVSKDISTKRISISTVGSIVASGLFVGIYQLLD